MEETYHIEFDMEGDLSLLMHHLLTLGEQHWKVIGGEAGVKIKLRNETIAALVKDGQVIHIDYAPVSECKMVEFTYGEVCIKCNVCGRFKDEPVPTEEEVRRELKGE